MGHEGGRVGEIDTQSEMGGLGPKSLCTGGGDIPCRGKYESTNSGATKSGPVLKNE